MVFSPLLALLPCLAAVSAQGTFGNPFGGAVGGGAFPSLRTGGTPFAQAPVRTSYTPARFPSIPGQQHRPKATIRAKNDAGDKIFLTIEEVNDLSDPTQALGGLLSPYFIRNPFQRSPRRATDLRVHGFFIKSGAKSGITSQRSLNGTFAMVIMKNRNTARSCIAIGEPYIPRSQRRGLQLPYGPGRQATNATNAYLQQQQSAAVVSTPLQANAKTATIEGTLKGVTMSEIYGSGFAICADVKCTVKTDMRGIVSSPTTRCPSRSSTPSSTTR